MKIKTFNSIGELRIELEKHTKEQYIDLKVVKHSGYNLYILILEEVKNDRKKD